MARLSIVIPARNEMFLPNTVKDILANIEDDTEIIVVMDGQWSPSVDQHERVKVVFLPESIGQRAATNLGVRLSKAKYVMKVDAHCSFSKGFDRKMLEAFAKVGDNVTMAPTMRNLWAFDWKCRKCGRRTYQGRTPVACEDCDNTTDFYRKMVWIGKERPQSNSFIFDTEPHFQYFNEYKERPEYQEMLEQTGMTESMSLQGSCFMLTREKYWELNICDETLGSWGSQGIEVACKTWLSGGQILINHDCWYAHLFKTQGGDFGFPYDNPESKVQEAKKKTKDLFFNNKWPQQVHPLSWLVEKFWPVRGWSDEDLAKLKGVAKEPTKGILYLSDGLMEPKVADVVQKQLMKAQLPITSVTLKPMAFGRNILVNEPRGFVTLFKQILRGLEIMTEDIVYLTAHDVLYHTSHFKFTPPDKNKFYYNENVWLVRPLDGKAVSFGGVSLTGLVAYREPLITHFKERLAMIEKEGFSYQMGFEPFTHKRVKWENWFDAENFKSSFPIVDIEHGKNDSKKRFDIEEYRNKPKTWVESDINNIPGWSNLEELLK